MAVDVVGEVGRWVDDLDSLSARELAGRLQDVERVIRAAHAVRAAVVHAADRSGAFREDGHLRVSSWVEASVRVSRREALDTVRLASLCATYPTVFSHLAAGTLGVRQAGDLARVHANPRVAPALGEVIDAFVTVAEHAPTTSSSRS